jgi:hypothetical protein
LKSLKISSGSPSSAHSSWVSAFSDCSALGESSLFPVIRRIFRRFPPARGAPTGAGTSASSCRGGRFLAEHDGINKIVAECWPDDEPHLTEVVDAAIEQANEKEETIPYESFEKPLH